MSLNTVKILGISITTNSRQQILEYLKKYLKKDIRYKRQETNKTEKPVVIVTPNPEQIVLAQKDKHFADILNRADISLPDGIGLIWARRFLGGCQPSAVSCQLSKRIPGIELMEDLISLAVREGVRAALIGGRGGVAVEAFERLKKKYPGLEGWAEDGPEMEIKKSDQSTNLSAGEAGPTNRLAIGLSEQYIQEIIKKIKDSKVRLIFVGLGAPKQELFIEQLSSQLLVNSSQKDKKALTVNREPFTVNALVLMSVGGSFNIIAGRIKRAPVFIRLIGFEWLWRLIQEPWRWRRQLALLEFIAFLIKEKIRI